MTNLLADLGGTYLRLARAGDIASIKKYAIAEYTDIGAVLQEFGVPAKRLYLAAAIHPRNGIIEDTRFGAQSRWSIHLEDLKKAFSLEAIEVLNDLEAAAYGLCDLPQDALEALVKPQNNTAHFANPPKLIIGIGTGIGHAFLFQRPHEQAFVQRSHGGHFLPSAVTAEQKKVLADIQSVKPKTRDIIAEDIVSGSGFGTLKNLYGEELALRLFAEFLGIYCHTLCSVAGAYGGVYLTGGAMDELMSRSAFDVASFQAYFHRPMVPVVMETIEATPVYYIRDPYMPIRGLEYLSRSFA